MEATGVYWKPVWHVLEDEASFELMLVNPAHFRNCRYRIRDVIAVGTTVVPSLPLRERR
jgi:hypothetical protein